MKFSNKAYEVFMDIHANFMDLKLLVLVTQVQLPLTTYSGLTAYKALVYFLLG